MSEILLFLSIFFLLSLPALSRDVGKTPDEDKYRFLYFASLVGGSHYINLVESGRSLARQGHHVVFLVSSSNPTSLWQKDAELSSVLVFNSSYTKQNRTFVIDSAVEVVLTGRMNFFGSELLLGKEGIEKVSLMPALLLQECDDLFSDSATMKRLQEERFDMLVGDDCISCVPMLAQALDIPFVLNSDTNAVPTKHGGWYVSFHTEQTELFMPMWCARIKKN